MERAELVERLRDATRNWSAAADVALGDDPKDAEAHLASAASVRPTRRAIEDSAIRAVAEFYDDSAFDYEAVVAAIDEADATWLYPTFLSRAIEVVDEGDD